MGEVARGMVEQKADISSWFRVGTPYLYPTTNNLLCFSNSFVLIINVFFINMVT